jgi:gliding motility-associated-like protein
MNKPVLTYTLRIFWLLLFALLFSAEILASHVRAGDITARRLPGAGLTYEFTILIYTDDEGVPPDEAVEVNFGDGSPSVMVPRLSSRSLGNLTTENVYRTTYTFAGPGEFRVGVFIRNRNDAVVNIPNSFNTPFYVESVFLISPFLGFNSSPVLTNAPVDFLACVGRVYIHNPGAVDADGDSLSYRFTISKRAAGRNVDVYYPLNQVPGVNALTEDRSGPATLTLDPIKGDLIWNAPLQPGEYNVAFFVDEWRNGVRIGSVNRDMQIIVRECINRPPVLTIPRDTCVVAGSLLLDTISSRDPDGHRVNITGFGSVFSLQPPSIAATLDTLRRQPPNGFEQALFRWQTTCNDVSSQPYNVTFRTQDTPVPLRDRLADFKTWTIRVVGPAPDSLIAVYDDVSQRVTIRWANYTCPNASQMFVYRRQGSFPWEPDNCETGIPAYTGYNRITALPINQNIFIDDNGGRPFQKGATYCYRIYAGFPAPKGGESYASVEVCVTIQSNAPLITNVSVERTATTDGEIFVRWVKPIGLNPALIARPYTYRLARAEGFTGSTNYTLLPGVFNENDTTFTDRNLDTESKVYNYRVIFFANSQLVDSSSVASSVRLTATPDQNAIALSWQFDVPWSNRSERFRRHYVYRELIDRPGEFQLIDSVDVVQSGTFRYVDRGSATQPLDDKQIYCYYVTTQGTYDNPAVFEPLLNKSQRACSGIQDVTAPCPPVLAIKPFDCEQFDPQDPSTCDEQVFRNELSWQPDLTPPCDQEIVGYNLYFTPTEGDTLRLLVGGLTSLSYIHERIGTIAGCYAVTAYDSAGNESEFSNIVCNDNCPYYALPNVITPNGDGRNDTFRPLTCPRFVERVLFRVYNRWGRLVYESDDDILLNWPGVNNQGSVLPSGIYYYEAVVSFIRLRPDDRVQTIKGWVQIIR